MDILIIFCLGAASIALITGSVIAFTSLVLGASPDKDLHLPPRQ